MKRFSLREFLLLCSPLLVVGVVGFLLARRKPPSPDANKPHLEFHIEKPTVLEAFNGSDAAFVVELKGPNTDYNQNKDPLGIWESDPFLEVQTKDGLQKSRWNNASGNWRDVWKGNLNGTRLQINSRAIPAGKLRLGMGIVLSPMSSAPSKRLHLNGRWTVNRALIKPFPFQKMARAPLVRLRSVKIIQINANGNIRGEAVFDLLGAAMNDSTPFDYDFKDRQQGMGGGYGRRNLTPTTRVREWTVYKDLNLRSGQKQRVHISGRVSADERWPLAFEFQPFDYNTAKAGQTLKWKSWSLSAPIRN